MDKHRLFFVTYWHIFEVGWWEGFFDCVIYASC